MVKTLLSFSTVKDKIKCVGISKLSGKHKGTKNEAALFSLETVGRWKISPVISQKPKEHTYVHTRKLSKQEKLKIQIINIFQSSHTYSVCWVKTGVFFQKLRNTKLTVKAYVHTLESSVLRNSFLFSNYLLKSFSPTLPAVRYYLVSTWIIQSQLCRNNYFSFHSEAQEQRQEKLPLACCSKGKDALVLLPNTHSTEKSMQIQRRKNSSGN